jgi:hypothetical protein
MAANEDRLQIHHLSVDSLPSNNSSTGQMAMAGYNGSYMAEISDETTQFLWHDTIPVKFPAYGVHAITLRCSHTHVHVQFWPCAPITQLDNPAPLSFRDPQDPGARIRGTGYFGLYDAGHSGQSVVLLINVEEDDLCLYLVRFVCGVTSVHQLQLPSTIDMADTNRLFWDEYRGTVYLSTLFGSMVCIPYA